MSPFELDPVKLPRISFDRDREFGCLISYCVHTWSHTFKDGVALVLCGRGLVLNTLHCFEKKNECPHDDKPSTDTFAVSDDVFSALSSSCGSAVS